MVLGQFSDICGPIWSTNIRKLAKDHKDYGSYISAKIRKLAKDHKGYGSYISANIRKLAKDQKGYSSAANHKESKYFTCILCYVFQRTHTMERHSNQPLAYWKKPNYKHQYVFLGEPCKGLQDLFVAFWCPSYMYVAFQSLIFKPLCQFVLNQAMYSPFVVHFQTCLETWICNLNYIISGYFSFLFSPVYFVWGSCLFALTALVV